MILTTCCPPFYGKMKNVVDIDVKNNLNDLIYSKKLFHTSNSSPDIVDSPVSIDKAPKVSSVKINSKVPVEEKNLFEIMKCEKNRQNSFEGKWPVPFISIKSLVDSGFFYLQSEDKTQCAFCGLILHSWEIGDEPLKLHIMSSSGCSFLSSKKAPMASQKMQQHFASYFSEYIPVPSTVTVSKPKFPQMHDRRTRLATFKNWPLAMIHPDELADCGLFYSGVSDVVTCFFCGGSLANWEPFDKPIIEHSKFYPNCNFLRIVKNRPTQSKKETLKFSNIIQLPQKHLTLGFFKSDVIRQAKEIFPHSLVDEVVLKHLRETGQAFTYLHPLCEKILEHEEKQLKLSSKSDSQKTEGKSVLCGQIEGSERQRKSNETKDLLLCKICMDQELGVVFQPCGHLVTCEKCATKISDCPLCRKPIVNVVRTYLG